MRDKSGLCDFYIREFARNKFLRGAIGLIGAALAPRSIRKVYGAARRRFFSRTLSGPALRSRYKRRKEEEVSSMGNNIGAAAGINVASINDHSNAMSGLSIFRGPESRPSRVFSRSSAFIRLERIRARGRFLPAKSRLKFKVSKVRVRVTLLCTCCDNQVRRCLRTYN